MFSHASFHPILNERRIKLKLSGSEVCYTNSLILLVRNMLCSKLQRQKDSDFDLIFFHVRAPAPPYRVRVPHPYAVISRSPLAARPRLEPCPKVCTWHVLRTYTNWLFRRRCRVPSRPPPVRVQATLISSENSRQSGFSYIRVNQFSHLIHNLCGILTALGQPFFTEFPCYDSQGLCTLLSQCMAARRRLGGQQMPFPRPWKMIRYFHSTVRNPS